MYVAGRADSADFPGIGPTSADSTFSGNNEAFVAKLNGQLSTVQRATFLGGSEIEIARALAVGATGDIYVAGETLRADFPGVGRSAADPLFAGSSEGFAVRLDPNLGSVVGATFLSGSNGDRAGALAVGDSGHVYVAGNTASTDFPGISASSADNTFAGVNEAFVAKLDANLSAVLAATYLGCSGSEEANALVGRRQRPRVRRRRDELARLSGRRIHVRGQHVRGSRGGLHRQA